MIMIMRKSTAFPSVLFWYWERAGRRSTRPQGRRQFMGRSANCATTVLGIVLATGMPQPLADMEPGSGSLVRVATALYSTANLQAAAPGATLDANDTSFTAQVQLGNRAADETDNWALRLSHRYRALEFNDLATRTSFNGDIHSLGVGVLWQRKGETYRRRVSLAPVIAVSSNALKNPDALTADAVHLWINWSEYRRRSAHGEWLVGIGVDDRLGEYGIYPIVGLTWNPHPGTALQLAFPDSQLVQQLTPRFALSLRLAPDGGQWRVFDKSLEHESDFHWENWRSDFALQWSHPSGLTLELGAGISLRQHMDMALEDGTTLATDLEDATFAGLDIAWRWR